MESGLWSKLVQFTREQVNQGGFYPSRWTPQRQIHADISFGGLCRDMVTRSEESDKDRLTEEEIWYNSGHAWAAATYDPIFLMLRRC